MIVAYKTGWITWALARGLLYKKTHITLLNILNDDTAIVPEFVQTRQVSDKIAEQVIKWIKEPGGLQRQREVQGEALARLLVTETPAARCAAGAIIDELGEAKS